jgi:predicted short-subunit dehydrogenase-like oxidoreductase (DUF2520 family)
VGATLGKRLRALGWRVGVVATRSGATARRAVRAIGAGRASSQLTRAIFDADIILIATPDAALASVARSLAKVGGGLCRRKVILHTSGALDRSVLRPLARCGADTGSIHPMQTFSGRNIPQLAGVTFAVEGSPRALRAARAVARALGGVPVSIAGGDKPAYHASAVLTAGSEFALIEAALKMLEDIGFSRRRALQTLLPLCRQMLDNIDRLGPRGAWTGPLSRGDYAVVARHMRTLRRYPAEFQQSYAALALLAGRVLSKNPAAALSQVRRALKNSNGGNR